jgi:hypothetical protein
LRGVHKHALGHQLPSGRRPPRPRDQRGSGASTC